ncbi:MAG: FG-GAP-like repeat-containing protein [Planctomycetota bacterium]
MQRPLCLLSSLVLCAAASAQSPFRATRFATLPQNLNPVKLTSGDLDGDGDLDLVAANDFFAAQVLINDGNGGFVDESATRLTSPAFVDNHCVDLVDIDGDGDLDLLMGNEDFVSNEVYVNNGAGVFTNVTATALPAQAFDTKNHVVADFDGDGDADWLAVGPDGCRYYENNGAGVFSDQTAVRLLNVPLGLGFEYYQAPPARDLDGDGDLDVLVPGVGGLLLNQNGVLTPAATQLPAAASGAHWLVDVDGDGDIDVFASYGRLLYENLGNGVFVDVTGNSGVASTVPGYGAFDVDDDGDVDLVRPAEIGFNDGTGVFTFVASSQQVSFGVYRGAVAADYDGDGDLDLPGLPNFLRHVDATAPPVIAGNYSVELHTRTGGAYPGLLVASFGAGVLPLGPIGTLRLDPASALVVGAQTGASPLTVTWALPNVPALVGTPLNYQGVVFDPLVGVTITNTFGESVQ